MKEIVVISGKGGTGKTSVTAALAVLLGKDAVMADCDVDAADMHLLLEPDFGNKENFYSGELAVIDPARCMSCGICMEKCRFSAISNGSLSFTVDPIGCEGCGYCSRVCPQGAIVMEEQNVGNLYVSQTRINNILVHARLGIAAENSGKLVARVKKEARLIAEDNKIDYIIVDGSPGIGCPVVSSLTGADYVLLVTEPTGSGLHDLERVYELVEKFGIKAGCIINKADINPGITLRIMELLSEKEIRHIANIPYNQGFSDAITKGKTIMEGDQVELKEIIIESWSKIKENV